MGAPSYLLRVLVVTPVIVAVGVVFAFGFTSVLEPFANSFGGIGPQHGWGNLAIDTLGYGAFGGLFLMLVIILWFIFSPIREDVRQELR